MPKSEHKFPVGVILLLVTVVKCMPQTCDRNLAVKIVDAAVLSNGSAADLDTNTIYPPETYWREEVGGESYIFGCPCKLEKPCLRKCCAKNQAMDNITLDCVPHEEPLPWFQPNISEDDSYNWRVAEEGHFEFIYRNICFGYLLEPLEYPEDKFYINFTDGTLSMPDQKKFSLGPSKFCLEYLPAFDSYLPYVCFTQIPGVSPPDSCTEVRYIMYPIGMSVSIFFLVITLVIYATTTELRNLHGKCLMCHIVSLLVAYLSLAVVQAGGGGLSDPVCIAFGFVIYFALLCTFFWLNIMCIDIYLTFSNFRPLRGGMRNSDIRKFISYMIYAWGIPVVIVSVTAAMEFHPDVPETFMKPKFQATCWFQEFNSRLIYFIVPVGVIVLCNLILFSITAFNIYKVNRETSILARGENTGRRDDKHRLKLYIKLSIVMGVSWILEILSVVVGGSTCIWLFTDMMNVLQGIFIFFIFVCKKNVKELMIKRLRRLVAKISPTVEVLGSGEPEESSSSGARSASTASTNLPSVQLNARFVKHPAKKTSTAEKTPVWRAKEANSEAE